MTDSYTIHAWCMRPFIACIDVQAETPQHALTLARPQTDKLLDSAEDCNGTYPWDEFAVYDENGSELLLHVLDEPARVRAAAPALHEALAWLATAAEDLDAAIDGATTEFDLQRNELAAACRHARNALATGAQLDIHQLLAARRQVAVIWGIEDVQAMRPDLTDDQAWQVLRQCERVHDCEIGFTWLLIETIADDVFPEPATTKE